MKAGDGVAGDQSPGAGMVRSGASDGAGGGHVLFLGLLPSCERLVTEGVTSDGKWDPGEACASPSSRGPVGQGDREVPRSGPQERSGGHRSR